MLIANIRADNLTCFRPLLSAGAVKRLREPGVVMIGAAQESEAGAQAVGLLAAQIFAGGAEIFWVNVAPVWRRQGVGSALLARLLESIREVGWLGTVFAIMGPEIPDSLRSFLGERGFAGNPVTEGGIPWLRAEALQHSQLSRPAPRGTVLVGELPKVYLRQAASELLYKDPAIEIPPRWETFAPCSTAFLKDKQIQAVLLFLEEDHALSLAAVGVRPKCSAAIAAALIAAVHQIRKQYPPETRLNLATLNDASKLIASLFPQDVTRDRYEVFTFTLI